MPACAAACLTLLDLETTLWWQPGFSEEAGQWLQFHTGARRVDQPHQGNFAVIWNSASLPELALFHPGVAEYPEASATLLIQVAHLSGGTPVELQGPGILGARAISPQLPAAFWPQWQMNHQRYPLGVDVLLFSPTEVMGLPRTTQFLSASPCS
jgi:alpha-D-ribose 1-methylphosphonate 5-triphosphate synthase subunit PhnH